MSGVRTAVSRLSMLAGAVLLVVGLGLRAGILAVPGPVGQPAVLSPSPGPAIAAVASTAPVSTPPEPGPDASAEPAPTPPPSPVPVPTPSPSPVDPSPGGSPWFVDEFDAVAAWPEGDLDSLTTSTGGGAYRIDAATTDLPVYLIAAAGEGAPVPPLSVAADLVIDPGSPGSAAGIALESADGTRLAAVLDGDGRVTLLRDSFVQLDELAAGSIDPSGGPVSLRLTLVGGTVTVSIDEVVVARAREPFEPVAVGLAIWARGPAGFEVLRYEVRVGVRS